MNLQRYQPTDDELKSARRRVVPLESAVLVIRGCVLSVFEGMLESQTKLLSDGGCVRAVPVGQDGEVNTATALDGSYLGMTFALQEAAREWAERELPWSEVERFSEIL